ncbi:MAG: murein biosynthesis integral membrane protein MurJ [Ilumatobacter sp.]|uniref:murein biosynthesis integral membrane protein MurJ n=1 Tax=Ilumatobacter sp. TaxID=1967498 RepID=UPI00329920A2
MSGLLKSNLTVAAGTALSRVTGMLRLTVLGGVLGSTALNDAYVNANETPNIVYELLLGGVLSATLVPLFSSFAEDADDERGRESTNVVITMAVALIAALTVIAVAAAPLIFRLFSLQVADDIDADVFRSVGTTLTRIFLIQILFYGLTGLANAFLNSRRRFFAAAWSPVLPNLIIIVTLLSLPSPSNGWSLDDVLTNDRFRWTLTLGATLGIGAMAATLIPAALRTGFRFRFEWQPRHPAVRRLLGLSFWTFGFVGANIAALVVVKNLTVPGSSDTFAYVAAFTYFVLPQGLLGVSIATTFQPELARSVARRDKASFVTTMSIGVRMTGLLTIPAGIGLFVLRRPLVGLFLENGEFDADGALNVSRALAGLALGLGAFSIYLFVLRGFYAHKDTKTAFKVNVVENAINILLAVLLVGSYGVLGLGAAYALAYVISAFWVLQIMSYKVPGFELRPILVSLSRMVVAGALMGEAVWVVARNVGGNVGVDAVLRLGAGTVAGIAVYFGLLAVMGAPELDALRRRLPARSSGRRPTPAD